MLLALSEVVVRIGTVVVRGLIAADASKPPVGQPTEPAPAFVTAR